MLSLFCFSFEIDYAHVKVIPIHKSTVASGAKVVGEAAKTYSGFVDSMPGQKVDKEYLEGLVDCYSGMKTL